MTRALPHPLLVLLVATALLAIGGTASASMTSEPAPAPYPTLGQPPAGANDWSCKPSARRPDPAVIVHGTFGDEKSLLDNLSLALKNDGYCVYALDYGNRGTGPIARSAHQLKRFVGRVLASTGASKVEMVGHSQGGMMPRYYIKYLGGAAHVEDLVGLSPSNHGTTVNSSLSSTPGCRACDQQRAGSAFLRRLNHPDDTPGRVDYTQVTTTHDEVVVPYTSAFLTPGRHSTNIVLQDRCPADAAEHLTIPMDRQAIGWVLDAFGRRGPAYRHAAIGCAG
jgi:triacylglycerol esterase/lipase EstA (alpha/beta hydrolase family)